MSQHRAGEDVKKPASQDTQTRSRLVIGQNGPSDSALFGACARACVPRRYTPSYEALGPAIALAEHVLSLGTPYDGTEGMVLQVHLRSAGSMLPYAREELVRVHRVALTLRESA